MINIKTMNILIIFIFIILPIVYFSFRLFKIFKNKTNVDNLKEIAFDFFPLLNIHDIDYWIDFNTLNDWRKYNKIMVNDNDLHISMTKNHQRKFIKYILPDINHKYKFNSIKSYEGKICMFILRNMNSNFCLKIHLVKNPNSDGWLHYKNPYIKSIHYRNTVPPKLERSNQKYYGVYKIKVPQSPDTIIKLH